MGKLDNVFTGDMTKFGPDIQTMVLVVKVAAVVNDIGDVIGRLQPP